MAPTDCLPSYQVTLCASFRSSHTERCTKCNRNEHDCDKAKVTVLPTIPSKQAMLSHLPRAKNKSPTVTKIGFLFTEPKRTKTFHVSTLDVRKQVRRVT